MDGADERPVIWPCVEEFVGNRRVPFLFGYFAFGQQKKVTRQEAKKGTSVQIVALGLVSARRKLNRTLMFS